MREAEGDPLLVPFDAPDVGAGEPVEVAEVLTPVGVGRLAKRSLDWKVTQFDDEGMRAV